MNSASSDPTYAWRLRAVSRASALRFPADAVNEAAGILTVVFGESWLSAARQDVNRSSVILFRNHPIGRALSTDGETQIVELLELAEYLKGTSKCEGFEKVVAGLKLHYWQTLPQVIGESVRELPALPVGTE